MRGRVLSIAGSDSGGGAGIQADVKTITALGGYAMTAITALTAQNTHGVYEVMAVPPGFVALQMTTAIDDFGADAIKTGMLFNADMIRCVTDALSPYEGIPIVVDPVMLAKGGSVLLDPDAIGALFDCLLPKSTVLTPNIPEAELLLGHRISTLDDMILAAARLQERGCRAVVLKGGHLEGNVVTDVLADAESVRCFSAPRIETRHTHGTGCTLASAVATGLAQNMELDAALERARTYLRAAIASAPGYGALAGPINHAIFPGH